MNLRPRLEWRSHRDAMESARGVIAALPESRTDRLATDATIDATLDQIGRRAWAAVLAGDRIAPEMATRADRLFGFRDWLAGIDDLLVWPVCDGYGFDGSAFEASIHFATTLADAIKALRDSMDGLRIADAHGSRASFRASWDRLKRDAADLLYSIDHDIAGMTDADQDKIIPVFDAAVEYAVRYGFSNQPEAYEA